MNSDSDLLWAEQKRKQLLKTPVMTVMETESISPKGTKGSYIIMDAPDWAIVIPVIGSKFLMVKQWRHGEQGLSIEFPGGVIESGETADAAAGRELKEETGYTARHLVKLGSINPNPALMSNHVHIYAAFDLQKSGGQNLDPDEYINCFELEKNDVYRNMGSKTYPHALMCSALFLYRQYEAEK